jgi:hypothetical protein
VWSRGFDAEIKELGCGHEACPQQAGIELITFISPMLTEFIP